jgi:flavorubredoxin
LGSEESHRVTPSGSELKIRNCRFLLSVSGICINKTLLYRWRGYRLKAIVVYLSTSGNTKAMAEAIGNGIESKNVDVKVVSFYDVKPEELNEAQAIAVGSSTFYYKMLLPMEKFMNETLVSVNPQGKIGAAFGSYGWSGEAPIMIAEKMREMGMIVVDPVLRILHKPTDKDLQECKRLGIDIAEKLKHKSKKAES